MIVRITGTLAELRDESVIIDRNGIAYEVLVCGYARGELAAHQGRQVTLHTMEYYEAGTVGGNRIYITVYLRIGGHGLAGRDAERSTASRDGVDGTKITSDIRDAIRMRNGMHVSVRHPGVGVGGIRRCGGIHPHRMQQHEEVKHCHEHP